MSQLTDFLIQFDQPQRVFRPGDLVSGQLLVNLSEQITFSKIEVELVGEGHVYWTETVPQSQDFNIVPDIDDDEEDEDDELEEEYSSSETYVHEVLIVHQGPDLPPGHHSLPFSLRLPSNLPSSFEGQYGGVTYYVNAHIVRNLQMALLVDQEEILITGMLDLNKEPTAMEAASVSHQKKPGYFCCRSGTLMASLNTDRTGYVSGETIQFLVEVENLSSNDMDSIDLRLVELVTFKACEGERLDERVVESLSWSEKILAKTEDDWEGSLTLPALAPTGLGGHCHIIDLQYRLELLVKPAGRSSPLVVSLPIILGTEPQLDSTPLHHRKLEYEDDLKPSCPPLPPSYTESQWRATSIVPPNISLFTQG